MNVLQSAVAQFRETRLGKRFLPNRELTPEELQHRIDRGLRVVRMMETDGWKDYQESVRHLIRAKKDGLCGLPSDVFQSARGLQLKGEIIGAQEALNQVTALVERGLAAEQKMKEKQEPETVRQRFQRMMHNRS